MTTEAKTPERCPATGREHVDGECYACKLTAEIYLGDAALQILRHRLADHLRSQDIPATAEHAVPVGVLHAPDRPIWSMPACGTTDERALLAQHDQVVTCVPCRMRQPRKVLAFPISSMRSAVSITVGSSSISQEEIEARRLGLDIGGEVRE